MIRFIDLRGQVFEDSDLPKEQQEPCFAFFNTVPGTFFNFSGTQYWTNVDAFWDDYDEDCGYPFKRFRGLMPEWALRKKP